MYEYKSVKISEKPPAMYISSFKVSLFSFIYFFFYSSLIRVQSGFEHWIEIRVLYICDVMPQKT